MHVNCLNRGICFLQPKRWLLGVLLFWCMTSTYAQYWRVEVNKRPLIGAESKEETYTIGSRDIFNNFSTKANAVLTPLGLRQKSTVDFIYLPPVHGATISFDIRADDGYQIYVGNRMIVDKNSERSTKKAWQTEVAVGVSSRSPLKIVFNNKTGIDYSLEVRNILHLGNTPRRVQKNQLTQIIAQNHTPTSTTQNPLHLVDYKWHFRKKGEAQWRTEHLNKNYSHLKLTGANDAVVNKYYSDNPAGVYEYYFEVTTFRIDGGVRKNYFEKSEIRETEVLCSTPTAVIQNVNPDDDRICRIREQVTNFSLLASGGTPPYTIKYTLNSGPEQTATQQGTTQVKVDMPDARTKEHELRLISVTDANGCSAMLSQQATIGAELDGAIGYDTPQICQTQTARNVKVGYIGGVPPYTLTYRLIEGDSQYGTTYTEKNLVFNNNGQIATDLVWHYVDNPPLILGKSYTYRLVSLTDGNGCKRNLTGYRTVTIAPPSVSASFDGVLQGISFCAGNTKTITGSGGTAPYTFEYAIDGQTHIVSTTGNSSRVNIQVPSQEKEQIFELKKVTDAKGCSNTLNQRVTYVPKLDAGTYFEGNNKVVCIVCKGQTTNLPVIQLRMVTDASPPFEVTWRKIVGGVEQSFAETFDTKQKEITHIPNEVGTFEYGVTSVGRLGCKSTLKGTKEIIVTEPSSINTMNEANFCLPTISSATFGNNGFSFGNNEYVFATGNTELDLPQTSINITPCCPNPIIKWRIPGLVDNEQTGQPSVYTSTFAFVNDTHSDKTYTIIYWLECNGVKSPEVSRTIVIKPRPNIEFN